MVVEDGGSRTELRDVRLSVIAPGAGLAAIAVIDLREVFRRAGSAAWELLLYSYEYRERPGPGRRAYHLHGGSFHAHCVDPAAPSRDRHYYGAARRSSRTVTATRSGAVTTYRATEVDAFEAHAEFARLYLSAVRVTCDDLRAALP